MNKWKHEVNFKPFWDADISVEEKGKCAASCLEYLLKHYLGDDELLDIIEDFKCVSGDGEPPETTEFTPTEDFDERMCDLYEWADSNRVWVAT